MDIDLGDAVATLRNQLLEAADRAATSSVEFVVGPIVSLTLTPRRPGGGDLLVARGPGDVTEHIGR